MEPFYESLSEDDFKFFVTLELRYALGLNSIEAVQRYNNWCELSKGYAGKDKINRKHIVENLGFVLMKENMIQKEK